ncbi:MAG: DUF4062 domain-containing protein [Pseudomonadota bacterium]
MLRVFLSSTSRDLSAYREAVHQAIERLDGFSLCRMEDFGARTETPAALCARMVGESQVLVGLLGHYSGACPPGERRSFTELEYHAAVESNVPTLMFFAPDDFPIPANLREPDESFRRQATFRADVLAARVGASFDSPEQLASAVTSALANWRQQREQLVDVQTERAAAAPASAHLADTSSPQARLGPNPYRGLEAFRKKDADRFFGREALVEELWKRFLELHSGEHGVRLLTILGPSGSGKSSAAQAGLLAELDDRPLPGRPAPPSLILTPEARPLESLSVALARLATGDKAPARTASEFEQILREREHFDGLRYLSEHMLAGDRSGLILLIDQFEEVFSLCEDELERDQFIGNLLHAAREPNGCVSILLTLRSDFLGEVNRTAELSQVIASQHVVMPVMGEAELRRAIEEPARRAGRSIDPATTQLLLEQTGGREGALPLLEFVLTRIWEGLVDGVAAADTVRALGGVGGALASKAQEVYGGLDQGERRIARRAFLTMVRLGEGTKDTRRRAGVAEMITQHRSGDDILSVLRRFSEPGCRLVSLRGEGTATTAEVTHEALFDHWRSLQDWLDESRDDIRFQRTLAAAADHWDEMGRSDGSLWRPPELDLLREFRAKAGSDLTPQEFAFATASERLQARRRWSRRVGLAAAIGGLLIVAGVLSVYSRQQAEFAQQQAELRAEADQAKDEAVRQAAAAEIEKRRADTQRDQARRTQSLLLAKLSERATEGGNATDGVLLALEALPQDIAQTQLSYPAEAQAALYRAVLAHRERIVLDGHEGPVTSASISPAGDMVLTVAEDGRARVWADPREPLAALELQGAPPLAAAFADQATVLAISKDGGIWRWDSATRALRQLPIGFGPLRSAVFSPDGARATALAPDGTVKLWQTGSSEPPVTMGIPAEGVMIAISSPRGDTVLTASNTIARLWDVATKQVTATLEGHGSEVFSVAFSRDGSRIATGSRDGTARLWNTATGTEIAVLRGHRDLLVRVSPGAFSPDGTKVVTASDDRTARLWDVASGSELMVLQGHDRSVLSAAFSGDGTEVVTTSADGTARRWNVGQSPLVTVLKGHESSLRAAAFDPSGERVITASHDLSVRLWDAESGREITALRGHTDAIRSVAFDGSGERAVTASDDGTARIWAIPSGHVLAVLKGETNEGLRSAGFDPLGETVVAATAFGVAKLWDIETGDPIRAFDGHEASVRTATFSRDGRYVLTASYDRTARIWDKATGTEVARLEVDRTRLNAAAFSPDGRRAAAAAQDGTVRVWDLASGKTAVTLVGHQGTVRGVQFSADGRRIVTASTDQTARVWDVANGETLAVLRGHERPVTWAEFSPDGRRVVTASTDDTARIWSIFPTTQGLIDYARSVVPRQLTAGQRDQFFLE